MKTLNVFAGVAVHSQSLGSYSLMLKMNGRSCELNGIAAMPRGIQVSEVYIALYALNSILTVIKDKNIRNINLKYFLGPSSLCSELNNLMNGVYYNEEFNYLISNVMEILNSLEISFSISEYGPRLIAISDIQREKASLYKKYGY